MAAKRGPKRSVGRPKAVEPKRKDAQRKRDQRKRLRALGLEPKEIWVLPGEIDDLLFDARLRMAEIELLYAIRDGDERTVIARREALNDQRANMGLEPIEQGELERLKSGERDVRDLAKGVHPDQLERVVAPAFLRGAVTNARLPMKQVPPNLRGDMPSYMVLDAYDPYKF